MTNLRDLPPPWFEQTNKKSFAALYKISAAALVKQLPDSSVSLVITSPPYCMGKEYEKSVSPTDFLAAHRALLPEIARVLKPGGSMCWQVGHHVKNGKVVPLDFLVYEAASNVPELVLRNRIIWTFGHGMHAPSRFSGRHESILWFTKGADYTFNLDPVRVPQKYPGKRHYKGEKKGKLSGNPLGKNPGDVWDIPNVKSRHVEKTDHPCQFPVALPRRLILAFSSTGDLVLDPFLGSGSTAIAAADEARNFIGCDIKASYLSIAKRRLKALAGGKLSLRPDQPPRVPLPTEAVSKLPKKWKSLRERTNGSAL